MKAYVFLIAALSILNSMPCFCQGSTAYPYRRLIIAADSLYEKKEFLKSAETYGQAFALNGGKSSMWQRYTAACAWAEAGKRDSAFYHLFRVVREQNFTNLKHMLADNDLMVLHDDVRWQEACDLVKKNKKASEANFDRPLMASLDTILNDDQNGRMQLDSIGRKLGRESSQFKDLWKTISGKDSINVAKVARILDERGWPGSDIVGEEGNKTVSLVIQHADLKTQEKYLPMMREAVRQKKSPAGDLAMLEDRVAIRNGRKQRYGTQVKRKPNGEFYVAPLEDPDNVNRRRLEEVNLPEIESYVSHFGIKWDVEAYKKMLPELEALPQE